MNWQPIETAPRDGTGFLYYQKLPFGQKWIGSAVYHEGEFVHVQWNGDECDWTTINPTHWMPLPAPPKADPECFDEYGHYGENNGPV